MNTQLTLIHVSENSNLSKLLAKVDKAPVLLKKDGKVYRLSKENETPNAYLRNVIKQAEKNYRKGNVSPRFNSPEEAVRYLEEQGIRMLSTILN